MNCAIETWPAAFAAVGTAFAIAGGVWAIVWGFTK